MLSIKVSLRQDLGQDRADAPNAGAPLALSVAIQDTGALAQGARSLGQSCRHGWRRIKRAEAWFDHRFLDARHGRGSTLTPWAEIDPFVRARHVSARTAAHVSDIAIAARAGVPRHGGGGI